MAINRGSPPSTILEENGWKRSNPWLTSFVDADPTRRGPLLGLASGRSGGCVKDWLAEQTPEFRNAVQLVVIDPSAPYASRIRAALPQARIAVDKWHLVALANQMVTEVRQRVTRDQLGRCGTTRDPVWVNRQLLLTGADHLSAKQLTRLEITLAATDPTDEIGAACAVKERLRLLLAESQPSKIRWRPRRLLRSRDRCRHGRDDPARQDGPDLVGAILVAFTEQVHNARTEGFNRIIKQTKRVGCGFRNMPNYQRRR